MKGWWRGEEVGRRLLCAGEESVSHLLLICPETQRCREELLKNKWSHIYEGTAIRKILTLKNTTELRKLGTSSITLNANWKIRSRKQNGGWRRARMRLCGFEKLHFFRMKDMKYFVLQTIYEISIIIRGIIMNS